MLSLTRKVGQRILIGESIIIEVAQIDHRGSVRIAIDAPASLSIDREEIRKRKRAQNRDAK